MDRCFHQSIRKHLPHTQHDLYLVNRIVSLYPYIIMALILLAVCLMLFFKADLQEHRDRGGISPILARTQPHFWECCRSDEPEDFEYCFQIGCRNPVIIPLLLWWYSVKWPLLLPGIYLPDVLKSLKVVMILASLIFHNFCDISQVCVRNHHIISSFCQDDQKRPIWAHEQAWKPFQIWDCYSFKRTRDW